MAEKVSRQIELPLTRDARLRLLSGIDPRVAGVGRRTWINVAELLKQVELCTGSDGCFAYCETLYDRMFDRRGMPRSTFFRVRRVAGRLGLLQSKERYARNGKTSSEWRVDWSQVAALAARSGTVLACDFSAGPESETDRSQSGTDRRQNGTDRSQSGTNPFKGLVLSSVSASVSALGSTVDRDDGDQKVEGLEPGAARGAAKAGGGVAGADLRGKAERIERRVGRVLRPEDWSLAVKAAAVAERLGESWLWDACEAVRWIKPQNRWGYFHRCLDEGARKRGARLDVELARTRLAAELLVYDGAAWRDRERLCGGGSEG